jgi:Flp pilus assembly protein TadG
MRRFLLSFGRDRQGSAALELGLMLPFLVLLHLAVGEFVQAWQVRTRVAQVAGTVSDITSQARSVTTDDLTDIFVAGDIILSPNDTATLGTRLTSMSANASGVVTTDWTISDNYRGGGVSLPSGFLGPNESVIIADVVYTYEPMFDLFMDTGFDMRHTAYARPRISMKVERR